MFLKRFLSAAYNYKIFSSEASKSHQLVDHVVNLNMPRFRLQDSTLSGLTVKDMKKYPHIVPFIVMMGLGIGMSTFFLLRAAIKEPEVMWRRRAKPEPWNDYKYKRYPLLKVTPDPYPTCPAPEYRE